jgi:hypothetical protein
MYGVTDANLTVLSGQFAMSFLLVMGLFTISNIFLKFNRDRLERQPRVSLTLVILALMIVIAAIGGNIAVSPAIVGYFAIFFVLALIAMTYSGFRTKLATVLYWVYNRSPKLHNWRWTRNWHITLRESIKKAKKQPFIFFAKSDEVYPVSNLLNCRLHF